jgi:hypothetical protein
LENYIVKQRTLRAVDMNSLVDFKKHNGVNLHYAYRGAVLFNSPETDVAAGVGVMALEAVAQAGIPLSAVTPSLGRLVHAALTYLALDVELWRFHGPAEKVAEFRSWITDGTTEARKRRVQELLGIFERGSSRFLLLSGDHSLSGADQITDVFGSASRPFTAVLDAWAFANKLKTNCSGALFIFETVDGK